MRHLFACIEQLQMAADELHSSDPLHGRLAMILVDNVVELICTEKWKRLEAREARSKTLNNSQDAEDIVAKKLRNTTFPGILNALLNRGQITQEERDLAVAAHNFRNELYHAELYYHDVIHPLTWHYFGLACDWLSRLHTGEFRFDPRDAMSARVRRHLTRVALAGHAREIRERYKNHPLSCNLQMFVKRIELRHLESYLLHEFARTQLALLPESLLQERPVLENPLEVILSGLLRSLLDFIDGELQLLLSRPFVAGDTRWLLSAIHPPPMDDWKPHLERVPVARWRDRAKSIRNEHRPARALQCYDALVRDIGQYANTMRAQAPYLAEFLDAETKAIRNAW